jgi:hypothetical protein
VKQIENRLSRMNLIGGTHAFSVVCFTSFLGVTKDIRRISSSTFPRSAIPERDQARDLA